MAGSASATLGPTSTVPESKCRRWSLNGRAAVFNSENPFVIGRFCQNILTLSEVSCQFFCHTHLIIFYHHLYGFNTTTVGYTTSKLQTLGCETRRIVPQPAMLRASFWTALVYPLECNITGETFHSVVASYHSIHRQNNTKATDPHSHLWWTVASLFSAHWWWYPSPQPWHVGQHSDESFESTTLQLEMLRRFNLEESTSEFQDQ